MWSRFEIAPEAGLYTGTRQDTPGTLGHTLMQIEWVDLLSYSGTKFQISFVKEVGHLDGFEPPTKFRR